MKLKNMFVLPVLFCFAVCAWGASQTIDEDAPVVCE